MTKTWVGTIEGLDCADCAATLAKSVEKLKGVRSASLHFGASKLVVEYDPDLLDPHTIIAEVKRSGYRLGLPGEYKRVALVVEGMDCADESTIVERRLRKLPGVTSVRFNLVAQEVRIDYDPARISSDQILEAVSETGMKARRTGRERPVEPFWERWKQWILTAVSGFLILAALLLSWAGYPHRLTDPLYVLAMVSGGYFIAKKALMALRTFSLDMNFLMTAAAVGAAFIEEWMEGATVLLLFSLANILQNQTMHRARSAIRALMELSPDGVVVKRNGREERVPVEEAEIGERMIIRPGEKFGLDGFVVEGSSFVNQAPITGESMPVEKNPGDNVFAGTINQNGSLEVEITHGHQDTTLSRIMQMVEEAQAQKAPSQSLVEKFSRYYTPTVIGAALLVAAVPPLALGHPFGVWFYRALVLLVIACPCALVISTPVSIVSGLTAAARHGVLIKGGVYLEDAGSLKVMAFDKTGTLTRGVPKVTDIVPFNGRPGDEVLRVAAAMEARSEHHLGKAIVEEAQTRALTLPEAIDFQSLTGKGARATVEGKVFHIGNHRLCDELGKCNMEIDSRTVDFQRQGKTAVILTDEDEAVGMIAIADEIREEGASAIRKLKATGLEKIVMLTGDNKGTAGAIASSLMIEDYRAELMPEDKARIVKELVGAYGKVGMVGDGVNDAPPMAAASIGIAMGAIGTDAALETADIALMTDDLSKLPFLIALSKKTVRIIRQNIAFSLLTKGVFIALTIPGLATLWMAVGADMGASLLVILNGLRLLRT